MCSIQLYSHVTMVHMHYLELVTFWPQVKDKESELKSAEQKLHDEFERLRRQNAEEKRQLDDKKRQLVRCMASTLLEMSCKIFKVFKKLTRSLQSLAIL